MTHLSEYHTWHWFNTNFDLACHTIYASSEVAISWRAPPEMFFPQSCNITRWLRIRSKNGWELPNGCQSFGFLRGVENVEENVERIHHADILRPRSELSLRIRYFSRWRLYAGSSLVSHIIAYELRVLLHLPFEFRTELSIAQRVRSACVIHLLYGGPLSFNTRIGVEKSLNVKKWWTVILHAPPETTSTRIIPIQHANQTAWRRRCRHVCVKKHLIRIIKITQWSKYIWMLFFSTPSNHCSEIQLYSVAFRGSFFTRPNLSFR